MTTRVLIQPTVLMHATSSHGITTLVITQGDCRLELAMHSDRVPQFYGDVSEALTPTIHEEQAKAEERKASLAEKLQEVRQLAKAAPWDDPYDALTEGLDKLDRARNRADVRQLESGE